MANNLKMSSRFRSCSSENFLENVSNRIQELKKASEESGLDLTEDLVKTLNQLSEIQRPRYSDDSNSDISLSLNTSFSLLQPTNSMLSISSMDSKKSLITSIKNKNHELQKTCSQKILELRSTTKEFCVISSTPQKQKSLAIELTTEKIEMRRPRANTTNPPVSSLTRSGSFNEILTQLNQLKSDLSHASTRIIESNFEITKQNAENEILRMELDQIILATSKRHQPNCGCGVF